MKKMSKYLYRICLVCLLLAGQHMAAQERRPIDSQHPLWMIHIDVWNVADPQKIIDLIPEDVKPYVCMNLSLSCQYDTEKKVYKMPRNAVRTYKSWATVCQHNGMWFTCQPASGGHTHIQDDDLETFEYFFKTYPNFLGWNYAEQFWGFDEAGDESSSTQTSRIALFAKLVEMSHRYGGFLTVSFCGNIWSHGLNPIGMMKRNADLLQACKNYPEAILWLYKYTTASCWYNNESVTWGPYVSGLAKNYGVRYDNCGWNGAMESLLGSDNGKKYPGAAGIGTVMEQTSVNGGAVWDGPELIWTEDFQNLSNTTVDGYTRRNWGTYPNFNGVWLDMFRKILDGTLYIPTREEVVGNVKIAIRNNVTSGNDENKYATWGDLYDGLYKQTDPFNRNNGQWMDNLLFLKKTGRYGTIPMVVDFYDDVAKAIPLKVNKSSKWASQSAKVSAFNARYPAVSTGDLYVNRYRNRLVTYTPYSYMNAKTTATAVIPLQYNTCNELTLTWNKLSSGYVREYADHIDFYLNNFRNDTTTLRVDQIKVSGCSAKPTYKVTAHSTAKTGTHTEAWDASTGTFTLNVSHCGGVEVVVNCSGDATDRKSDTLPTTALPTPLQPAAYTGPVVIEAENMDYKSVQNVVLTSSGYYVPDMKDFAGMGYVETGSNSAASLRHKLTLSTGGEYIIYVRYCDSDKAGSMSAVVNGTTKTLTIAKADKNDWRKASIKATLKAGENTLVLTNSRSISMKIDQVIYEPVGTAAETYAVTVKASEHGSIVADKATAAEGETVTLTVSPDEGYGLQELRVVNSVFYTQGKTIPFESGANSVTFTMPDENVTIQPVFYDKTAGYDLVFDAFGKADTDLAMLRTSGGLSFDASTGALTTNGTAGTLELTFAVPVSLQYLDKLIINRSGDADIIDRLYFYEDDVCSVENQSWFYSRWGGTTDANATNRFTGKTIKKVVWKSEAGKATTLAATITGITWQLKLIGAMKGTDVTTLPFKNWSADGDNDAGTGSDINSWECQKNFNVLTSSVVYGGDGIGGSKRYVDLTNYKKLIIRGYGEIRLFYNWHQKVGEETEDVKPETCLANKTTNVETLELDIPAFMEEQGISHFHLVGVKPYWGKEVFVESISAMDGTETTDYSLTGVGHPLPSVTAALADAAATGYDATGLTNTDAIELTTANPNALFVANAGSLSNAANVIVDDACEALVLTDGYAFKAPADFTASVATYQRALAAGKTTTVCLPFAIGNTEAAAMGTFYALSSFDGSTLHFTPVDAPEANTPYLLVPTATSMSLSLSDVSVPATPAKLAVEASDAEFIGTMAPTVVPASDATYSYYAYNNGEFVKVVTTAATLPAFRGYFKVANGSAGSRVLGVSFDEASGIEKMRDGESERMRSAIFDLSGRRVAKTQKGVYIVNGKKVVQ